MRSKGLLMAFCIALGLESLANGFTITPLQLFSKPSLMLILLAYFIHNSNNHPRLKNLIIAAIFFSWLGDVILLFEKNLPILFVFGLVSFLFAHIFYTIYFWQIRKYNCFESKFNPLILIGVISYTGIFYLFIFPSLSTLQIPVLIYCLVISLMLITSLQAFEFEKQTFGKICVSGTFLFAISDSILAINRFVFPILLGKVLIMLTYAVGQLLIVEGALRNLRKINAK
jgi:uncharacterized membrane protein YhhN